MIVKERDSSKDFMVTGITEMDLAKYHAWLNETDFSGCIGIAKFWLDGKLYAHISSGVQSGYNESLEYFESQGHEYEPIPLHYLVTYDTVALKIAFVYTWLEQLRKDFKNTDPADVKQVAHMTKIGKEAAQRVQDIEIMFKDERLPYEISKAMGLGFCGNFMEFVDKVRRMNQDKAFRFISSGVASHEFMELNYEQLQLLYWGNTEKVINYSLENGKCYDDCLEIVERSGM